MCIFLLYSILTYMYLWHICHTYPVRVAPVVAPEQEEALRALDLVGRRDLQHPPVRHSGVRAAERGESLKARSRQVFLVIFVKNIGHIDLKFCAVSFLVVIYNFVFIKFFVECRLNNINNNNSHHSITWRPRRRRKRTEA